MIFIAPVTSRLYIYKVYDPSELINARPEITGVALMRYTVYKSIMESMRHV